MFHENCVRFCHFGGQARTKSFGYHLNATTLPFSLSSFTPAFISLAPFLFFPVMFLVYSSEWKVYCRAMVTFFFFFSFRPFACTQLVVPRCMYTQSDLRRVHDPLLCFFALGGLDSAVQCSSTSVPKPLVLVLGLLPLVAHPFAFCCVCPSTWVLCKCLRCGLPTAAPL